MKIETYEALIDGFIEKSKITGWYILCSTALFLLIWLFVDIFVNIIVDSPDLDYSLLWHVGPASVVISFPVTLFWYYYRQAKSLYDVRRFRDVWMGFSTKVTVDSTVIREKESEIEKWLKENVRHMHKKTDYNHYVFASKSDAMAFKLAWYE